MKKLYLSLLLITTATTSCMELLRDYSDDNYNNDTTEIPLTIFKPNPYAYTNTPPSMAHNQQAYDQSIDPNWPKYNEIMDMNYQPKQPMVVTNANDLLVPIYVSTMLENTITSTSTPLYTTKRTNEKKALLRTKPQIQPNNTELMEKIYNDVYTFFQYKQGSHYSANLAKLINTINKARSNGINEETMGKFAYEKQPSYNFLGQQVPCAQAKIYTTLFFSCLKRYTLTVEKTKESLPFEQPSLAEIFDISPHTNKKCDDYHLYSDYATSFSFKNYNAFCHLEYVLRHLTIWPDFLPAALADYLYAKQLPTIKSTPQDSSLDLKNKFYDMAYNLLFKAKHVKSIFEILTVIETAKKLKIIDNEIELGYDILGFTPTTPVTSFFDAQYSTAPTKSYIALFCILIGTYNKARNTKVTPTFEEHYTYSLYKALDLVRPDSCNCIQLNKKHYAFCELKQLMINTITLWNADDKSVEQEVAKRYPLAKKVT